MIRALRSVVRFRRPELSLNGRRLRRAANIADLRELAKRRLPRGVFDYIDGAAEDEIASQRNINAFGALEFRPRVLMDVSNIDTTTELLGRRVSTPLILSPTGFTRMVNPEGELAVARAADRAGVPYALSSLSTRSIEEVRSVSSGDLWFQVYVWRDRGLVAEMLERAKASLYSTIVITVDTAVLGRRERDIRRGFTLPPSIGPGTVVDGLRHPTWTWGFLRNEPIRFANVRGKSVGDGTDPVSLADLINSQFDPGLSWEDILWFRDRWEGSIVLKGIQEVTDAELAAAHELDGIALSNHGGRQLDGAPPPLALVAPVADRVGDRLEVYCDGGVRRGSDIAKAQALGAHAVMAGRAYLYGLAAAGEDGVEFALRHLHDGYRDTLALLGCQNGGQLHPDHVRERTDLPH